MRPAFYLLPMVLAIPFVAGAITPLAIERLSHRAWETAAARTRTELALLRDDLLDPGTVQVGSRRRVHHRVFTAARSGYLRFGDRSRFLESRSSPAQTGAVNPRRDRRGYFLDPWNSPYWFYYVRLREAVIVYSFGPNRRRDTHFTGMSDEDWRAGVLKGDDIGVSVTLPKAR